MTEQVPALQMVDVHRTFGRGDSAVRALRGVSVDLPRGSFVAVMGPSGSGKSTFLNCAAGLDRPSSGQIRLAGTDIAQLSERQRSRLRREQLGFVFQSYNLLPALTVQDNITLPLRMSGRSLDRAWAQTLVERTGLGPLVGKRPGTLSGGQQQRVAIARALVTRPELVLADEPTGALDSHTAAEVLDLLRHVADDYGQTVLMVTHDPVAASRADTVLFLADGLLVDAVQQPSAPRIAERMTQLAGAA